MRLKCCNNIKILYLNYFKIDCELCILRQSKAQSLEIVKVNKVYIKVLSFKSGKLHKPKFDELLDCVYLFDFYVT